MKKINFLASACIAAAMVSCCGGNEATGVTMGSSMSLDSLSYSLGVNVASSLGEQMADVPLDFKLVKSELTDAALVSTTDSLAIAESTTKHNEAISTLRNFFMNVRPAVQQEIAKIQSDSTITDKTLPEVFKSEGMRDSVSRAMGNDIGFNLKNMNVAIQINSLTKGIDEVRDGSATMTAEEAGAFLQNYFMVVVPQKNLEASEAWLAEIEKQSGVQKTESGLLYKIVEMGDTTVMPTSINDRVKVNYEGKNRKDKIFDSSYERGTPAEFGLNQVIKGWGEGLQLVGKGGQILLWIPAELAYGERGGMSADIGPNDAIMFKVDLLDVTTYVDPAAEAVVDAKKVVKE